MAHQHYTQIAQKTSTEWARRRRPLITLTPLVDVVFIMLVFFMLASNFLDWQAVTLTTPSVGASTQSQKLPLLVRVRRDDGLDLNGELLTLEQLQQRAAQLLETGKDYQFLVQPDRGVRLQQLVIVLDALAAAGHVNISLVRK